MNKDVEEKMKALEEGLQEMFKTDKYGIDFKHEGGGKYQFTNQGEPCVFDEESEFRLRIFLNSFSLLTEAHERRDKE